MKNKCKRVFRSIRSYFRILADGKRGAEIALLILLSALIIGILYSMYGFLPWYLVFPLSVVAAVLVPFVLFGLLWLIFGTERVSRAMFLSDLFVIAAFAGIGCQGNQIPFVIFFSLLAALAVDVLGRCLYLLLYAKRRIKSVWISGSVSLFILLVFAAFLIPDGFARGNTEKYAKMQKTETTAPSEFAQSVKNGDGKVQTVTYGTGDEFDLNGSTYDLSAFAKRNFPESLLYKLRFDYDLSAVPLSGKIWYPQDRTKCPLLFIVHGNHDIDAESYLGYEYLGEYLASNGYAVISVDENSCNGLSEENDARAVLLLENIAKILAWNADEESLLYEKFDPAQLALAGHSRGGEAVCLAALFNNFEHYPENGNIAFDYHFPIRSLIAIAPVCDQYIAAGKATVLTDVNYLLIHGLNDQDVSKVMGEKQYYNIRFTGKEDCFKSALFLNGANHGQFNTLWGRYDSPEPVCRFLDVHDLMGAQDQQQILCAFMKTFLDVTMKDDETYKSLFYDLEAYKGGLPDTALQQMYEDSSFSARFDFDTQKDIGASSSAVWKLHVENSSEWTRKRRNATSDADEGNLALAFHWGDKEEEQDGPVSVTIETGGVNLTEHALSFDLADRRQKKKDLKDAGPVDYRVTFTDVNGKSASVKNPRLILPSVGVQLYKPDVLFGQYEYKHQFATVHVSAGDCKADSGFDAANITEIQITFNDPVGDIEISEIGICQIE
ncbi:MAG: hypothetical protein K5649_00775 [Lachnospiraceae bacterium]|nr:hypothetical protein [Lachnospiraceae bacterium]